MLKKWKNLLTEQCPKCGSKLFYKKDTENFECALYDIESDSVFSCDFAVSPQRLEELKQKISTNKVLGEFEHDNAKYLNNYNANKS